MGLEEKRRMQMCKDETVPRRQGLIQKAADAPIVIEVDWNTFADDLAALENIDTRALDRISDVIQTLGGDAVGKQALKEGLKKIVVINTKNSADMAISMKDGVFTMKAQLGASSGGSYDGATIRKTLEAGL